MKLLLGGSPCTHWSIAQTKNRETQPKGLGWELFKNYLIALEKFKPDYFLYENNKSMSVAIREQISKEFGVKPICINSALVSAQNRRRLYWIGRRNPDGTYSKVEVEQPEDRGILLRDVLDSGIAMQEKSYCLTATYKSNPIEHSIKNHTRTQVTEPINITTDGKSRTLKAQYYKNSIANFVTNGGFGASAVAEPIRIGTIESAAKNTQFDSQQYRVYSPDGKSVTICGQGGGVGAKTGLYAVPVDTPACLRYERTEEAKKLRKQYEAGEIKHGYHEFHELHPRTDGKSNTLTTVQKDNMIIELADGKTSTVYEVREGKITIKGKQYPIRLKDGLYIIRKLTVNECKRLQTVPDWYEFPVSDTQAYKMLGNGWTVDVIAHILSYFPGIAAEQLEVLSMYDGMSCGQLALQKLGGQIDSYFATEIDKYAIKTTQHNFPNTIQLGDAFQVKDNGWELPKLYKGDQ